MAINLNYGLDGVRQKDYRVWIYNNPTNLLYAGVDSVMGQLSKMNYLQAYTKIGTELFNESTRFGECRKDSIIMSLDDGNSIEGNEVGEFILNKDCSFTAELINATPQNINALADNYDGKPVIIVLESLDGYEKLWKNTQSPTETTDWDKSTDTREIIVIGANPGGTNLSVSEAITGADVARATISMSDNVPSIDDFRTRFEIPYDIDENYGN